jgi:HAD superfamily hydrolase (TIGR01549 family)
MFKASESDILAKKSMHYTTLIFDAFDTIIHINTSKLPKLHVDGKEISTTAPAAYDAYTSLFGKIDFDVFYSAFSHSFTEITARRRADLREILSQERFQLMLRLLGHHVSEITPTAVETITTAHMRQLQESFEVRPESVQMLDWAKPRFRIAMISNFAYAPTLHESLDYFRIRPAFERVVVSAEVGWCKPHRIIFDHAFERMGIQPSEALFVGDQLYVDVYGALNSGMDVAWIETERQDWLPTEIHASRYKPTYSVRVITDLIQILENKK